MPRSITRRFAILIIFLLLALQFFRCAPPKATLTFWIGGTVDEVIFWETLLDDFEKQTGVELTVVRQPTDSEQRRQGLALPLASRRPDPDVFLMDVVWIGHFAHSGWLEPLDSAMSAPFFPEILQTVDTYADTLFALPVYVDGGLLYYRQDLLERHGYSNPPETWQELVEVSLEVIQSQRRVNPGFTGFIWQGAQYEGLVCTFLEFTASNNGGIIVDGRIQLNHPCNIAPLTFMRDLIHHYQLSPPNTYTEMKEEEARRLFQRGDVLFERNWPYAWKLHQRDDSPVKGKVGIAPLPHFEGGRTASTLGGWHIGISRFSDVKPQAGELVKWITSRDTQKKLALNLGWNPGRMDVYTDPDVLQELPHLNTLQTVFRHAVARPNLPYYTQISSIIQRYVNQCLAGEIEPREALNRMQDEINHLTGLYEEEGRKSHTR